MLLLECLKDGVITKEEWLRIKDAIAEIIGAQLIIDPSIESIPDVTPEETAQIRTKSMLDTVVDGVKSFVDSEMKDLKEL